MYSFLIQCIIIHFCHHSFWCSNFPYFSQGDPLKQSPYPFNLCISCWFSNTRDFLCFLTQEITSSLYSELAPVLEAAISPGSFSGESCLQTKNWMWLCFLLFRCHCFWAFTGRGRFFKKQKNQFIPTHPIPVPQEFLLSFPITYCISLHHTMNPKISTYYPFA